MRELPMSTSEILRTQEMPSMRKAGSSFSTSLPWWRLCTSLPVERSTRVEEMLVGPTVCPLQDTVGVGEWIMEDLEHQIDIEMTGTEEDLLREEAEMISEDLQEGGISEMTGDGGEVLQEDLQDERIRRTSSLTTWTI